MRDQFEVWLKSEWPKALTIKYNSGDYRSDHVQQSWIAWQASRTSIELPPPCPQKSVGPNPFRSNYAVGWDDCLAEIAQRIGELNHA